MWSRVAHLLLLTLTCGPLGVPARGVKNYKSLLTTKWLSNGELSSWMDDYVSRCGSIARKFSIGKSVRRRTLWALEISDKPGSEEAEPNFKYIANMHGDEISGRALLPLFAEWLCENNVAGGDARAARIVKDMHIFLIPTMNPDGYPLRRGNRGKTRGGYDLNRNFPDHYRDAGKDLSRPGITPDPTQPEVQAMMEFLLSRTFVMGANFHEGSLVANYPWDGYESLSDKNGPVNAAPDFAVFKRLAEAYALNNKAMSGTGPFKRQNGTTNGADWYPIYGGMQDWDYVVAGSMHLTLEVSEEQTPHKSTIPRLWSENQEALIALPLASLIGVRGTVQGPSGPLQATLHIKPVNNTAFVPFYSAKATGFYARPLQPGVNYTIVCQAAGFKAQEAAFVVPADGIATVDFTLAAGR